jgi:DNA-binding MarR family transcriptional regulator
MQKIEQLARLYPRLIRVMGRLRNTLQEGMDLSYNQFKMLLTIHDRGCCPLTALSEDLHIAMSSASEMVDRLVQLGLIHRTADPGNRRRITIQLTAKGVELIGELQRGIIDNYRILLARLTEEEQERLVDSLQSVVTIMEKLGN